MSSKVIHTFTWRMFHTQRAYGSSIEEARAKVLAERPAHIPEGTELRYLCSRGPREEIRQATQSSSDNQNGDA